VTPSTVWSTLKPSEWAVTASVRAQVRGDFYAREWVEDAVAGTLEAIREFKRTRALLPIVSAQVVEAEARGEALKTTVVRDSYLEAKRDELIYGEGACTVEAWENREAEMTPERAQAEFEAAVEIVRRARRIPLRWEDIIAPDDVKERLLAKALGRMLKDPMRAENKARFEVDATFRAIDESLSRSDKRD
jgi:hypothetical protein